MGPVGCYARAHAAVSQPVAAHPCGGHLDRGHAVPLAGRRAGPAPGGLPAAPRRPVPEDGLALPSAGLDLPRRPDPDGDRQRGLLRGYNPGVSLPESAGHQARAGRRPGGDGRGPRLYHRPARGPGPVPRWVAPDRHRSADGPTGALGGPAQPAPRSDHPGPRRGTHPQPLTCRGTACRARILRSQIVTSNSMPVITVVPLATKVESLDLLRQTPDP